MSKRTDVGYKRPPTEHRFKKGQSGNPKGRAPKKSRQIGAHPFDSSLHKAWLEEANKEITVVINGRSVCRTMGRLAIERTFADAAAGKPTAQLIVHRKMSEAESVLRDRWIASVDVDATLWRRARAELDERTRAGEIDPVVIPHPDDFVFNKETNCAQLIGPLDEEQHKAAMYFSKRAGALADILNRKLFKDPNDPTRLSFIEKLIEWNGMLPPRLKHWPKSQFSEDWDGLFPEECLLGWAFDDEFLDSPTP